MAKENSSNPSGNFQLEKLVSEYQVFVENQVLTHEQLNEITSFFEIQTRQTRASLVGVGIVCGLKTEWDEKNSKIMIRKGVAVTTDGDLISINDTLFSHFRKYDNKQAGYPPFFSKKGSGQVMLFELVDPDNDQSPELAPPQSLSAFPYPLKEMYVLLYVEYFLKQPGLCTSIDCDKEGQTRINRVRVLLLPEDDLKAVCNYRIAEKKGSNPNDLFNEYFDFFDKLQKFPRMKAKRVIPDVLATENFKYLTKKYSDIVANDIDRVLTNLQELIIGFDAAYKTDLSQNTGQFVIKAKKEVTEGITLNHGLYVQYIYDFYTDLIEAYNELLDKLHQLVVVCKPDVFEFPKHIMLGRLGTSLFPPPVPYRHIFYPSPAVTINKDLLSHSRFLISRVKLMLELFFTPDSAKIHGLHITPSFTTAHLPEERAIPFYYDYNPNCRLHYYWNYGKTARGQQNTVLSYYGEYYADNQDETENPLDYDFDRNNFFRIEGHVGKEFRKMMREIDDQRREKNLPFDLLAVRLGKPRPADFDPAEYEACFDDLKTILAAWKKEHDCVNAILLKFFSGFTTKPSVDIPAHINQGKINEYLGVIYQSKIDFSTLLQKHGDDIVVTTADPSPKNAEKKFVTIGKLFPDLTGATVQAFEVINKFNLEVAKDQDVDSMEDDDKELVLKTPAAIIGHLADAAQYFPSDIIKLNPFNLLLFKDRIKALCNFLQTARSRTEMILLKPTYKFKGYERQYMSMLSLLATYCCAGEKMEELYMETERRKNKILERLTLKKFYEEHPGLEHKAGVPKGGTFVVLYAARSKRLAEPANPKQEILAGEEAEISRNFLAYFRENETELKKLREKNPSLHEKIKKLLEITHVDEIADLVIGDFCLPYQLSSKLPPLSYVIEKIKEPLLLNLPGVAFCSGAAPVKFSVLPENAMVAAKDDACSAAVEKTGEDYYFIPKNVPPAFYGLPVSFTVNGQPPDKTFSVKVYEQPVAGFKTVTVGEDLSTNATVEIAFTANPDRNPDNFTYHWAFHDGSEAAGKTCTKVFDKRELMKNSLKEIPVTLKAMNGPCPDTITLPVQFTPYVRIKLGLPVTKTCEKGAIILFSEYAPPGAEIASPEAPNAVINGAQPAFNPGLVDAAALNAPIHFTVNGKPTTCEITVYRLVTPGFRRKSVQKKDNKYLVTIENMTKVNDNEDVTFSWDVSSADKAIVQHFETKKATEPVVVIMTYEEYKILQPKPLIVKLIADNHGCRTDIEKEIQSTMETAHPCLDQMFDVFSKASELLLSRKSLEGKTKDEDLLFFNDKVNELYDNLLKQKVNFKPTFNMVKNIRGLIESLSKMKASYEEEKEYLNNLFLILFTFLFGVVKCTDCKTLLKTEIQGLMPRFDDPFGILIREMIDRFRKDKHKMKQIEAAMADFLAHRVCAGMDGFFEEMRGWLQNN